MVAVLLVSIFSARVSAQEQGGLTSAPTQTAVSAVLTVGGDVPSPLKLSQVDVAKLPHEEIRTKDRLGEEAAYAGPTLAEILRVTGLKFDPATMPPKGAVASYVLIEARDGYKALFALAEIDPTLSRQVILLADTKDGQPLSPAEGPWRIIVPGDKRPARSVRQVTKITVHGG